MQVQKIREFAKKKPIDVVYLFGSQTGDSARHDSDYDFGVLFSDLVSSGRRFDLRLEIMELLTGTLETDKVDVLDLNSSPIGFQYEAIKPRRIIYEKNSQRTKQFEYNILTNYLDEMYYLKQATRESLAQIASIGIL